MKKLTECFDQWDNLPTYVLADTTDVDQYRPMLKGCNSLDDFEDKVCANVIDKVDDCRKNAQNLECDPTIKLMLLASIEDVNINDLVQKIMSCFSNELRIFKLESRVNQLYNLMLEKKQANERSTTSPHEGDMLAFNIATKFDKDDVDVDSTVDAKNKKDAWTLRLVYNDSSQDEMSLVKVDDDKDDYILKSNKDKLKVKFTDDDSDDKMAIPQELIDHIQKHISNAEAKNDKERKAQDADLAHEISYEIKKAFPNYDMEVIEGDVQAKNKWSLEIIYEDGAKDHFSIKKLGDSYIMTSKDLFLGKFSLSELKNFPKKLAEHIQKHINKSKK